MYFCIIKYNLIIKFEYIIKMYVAHYKIYLYDMAQSSQKFGRSCFKLIIILKFIYIYKYIIYTHTHVLNTN